ncbi:0-sialoglycoprotein endopeptidase [Spraguea lophii 42_110]|uniref:N(6)-L-threonylcarbamoyladenine synthase n=1 Tax=Spraguea lophii (strain 42_110) TaxID=1358809 RepID=S7W8S4_SPRLO|nr:0-sialoglycoprotein endopeptidase [Spraguea lophii 42_110]
MLILGIEGSANKLGIGILQNTTILCNERITYISPPGTGFVPSAVALHHSQNILPLFLRCCSKANINPSEIDLVAFTKGPGMGAPLSACALFARVISNYYNKPIIGVNHCIAHIEMGRFITNAKNPVILYASGGNTQIIARGNNKYFIYGETLDIAAGNALDRIARQLNISNDPSPGLNIELNAKKGKNYIKTPYVVKGMDISFSGIISHTKNIKIEDEQTVYDLCYSLQENIFSALVEVTERTMALLNSKEVLIVGGVGCNKRLQEMMKMMAEERGGVLYATDERYCIDNGIMIAYTGKLMYESNIRHNIEDTQITQRFRTDSVEVLWK